MFVHTDVEPARWNVVEAEDKRSARINMIHHLLSSLPYSHVEREELVLPERPTSNGYRRTERSLLQEVPDYAASLAEGRVPSRTPTRGRVTTKGPVPLVRALSRSNV